MWLKWGKLILSVLRKNMWTMYPHVPASEAKYDRFDHGGSGARIFGCACDFSTFVVVGADIVRWVIYRAFGRVIDRRACVFGIS